MYFLSLPSNRENSCCSSRTNLTHWGNCESRKEHSEGGTVRGKDSMGEEQDGRMVKGRSRMGG